MILFFAKFCFLFVKMCTFHTAPQQIVDTTFKRSKMTFYRWTEIDIIRRLLNGFTVHAFANASHVEMNAVKFNTIDIHFKLNSSDSQREFHHLLHKFNLKLQMLGSNDYRCGHRILSMSINESITIDHSFREIKIDNRYTYEEFGASTKNIMNNDAFLSPYTLWGMQIYGGDLKALTKYINSVQYVRNTILCFGNFQDTQKRYIC